jgi:hypothetical protein
LHRHAPDKAHTEGQKRVSLAIPETYRTRAVRQEGLVRSSHTKIRIPEISQDRPSLLNGFLRRHPSKRDTATWRRRPRSRDPTDSDASIAIAVRGARHMPFRAQPDGFACPHPGADRPVVPSRRDAASDSGKPRGWMAAHAGRRRLGRAKKGGTSMGLSSIQGRRSRSQRPRRSPLSRSRPETVHPAAGIPH